MTRSDAAADIITNFVQYGIEIPYPTPPGSVITRWSRR